MIGYIRRGIPGNSFQESVYTYNGTKIATFQSIFNGIPSDLYTASFINGNLTTWTGGTTLQTNYYYPDQPAQPGDLLYFAQLVNYGHTYFRNKNLLRSSVVNNVPQKITYTYDADGKIRTARSENSGAIKAITYVYSCD